MSNYIKTFDLCERCKYDFYIWCRVRGVDCGSCPQNTPGHCLCSTVKENTPCPYFEEREKEGEKGENHA